MGKEYYDTKDLTEILNCSEKTIYQLVNDDLLIPISKAGRPFLFPASTVKAVVDNGIRFNTTEFEV